MQLVFEFSLVVKLKTVTYSEKSEWTMYSQDSCCRPVWTLKSNYRPSYPEMRGRFTAVPRVMCGTNFSRKSLIKQCLIHSDTWRTQATLLQHLCAPGPSRSLCRTATTTTGSPALLSHLPPKGNHRGMATTSRQPSVTPSHLHLRKPLRNGHHTDGQPSVTVSSTSKETIGE